MSDEAWLHILQLSATIPMFKAIAEDIQSNEAAFLPWYNSNEPEKFPIPILEPRIADLEDVSFFHLRC
jgi:hypothetical protein